MEPTITVADRIEEIRKSLAEIPLSNREIARRCDTDEKNIRGFLAGSATRYTTLAKIERFLSTWKSDEAAA